MVTRSAGEAPDGLEIIGGAGGTAARLEDLDRCTAALRAAADDLSDAWWALGGIQNRLDEWGRPPLLPDAAATHAAGLAQEARAAVDAARSGAFGLRPLADGLRATADDLASARTQYARAESLASRLWRGFGPVVLPGVWHPVENLRGRLGPADGYDLVREWEAWLRGGDIPAEALERLVDRIARTSPITVPGPRDPDEDPVPGLAWAIGWMSRIPSRKTDVRALPVVGDRRTEPPPGGAADLVRRLTGLVKPDDAVVEVSEVRRSDGTSAWVVAIPGTQAWDAWSEDPLDLGGNLALMGNGDADSARAVVKAMEAAGIGRDDPVVLAGHSQGGLIASRVAAAGGYAVAAVLTVGSPTGSSATPASVPTLGLEHTSDPVPALDGKPPRDEPLRTTVRGRPDGRARRSASHAHATPEYEKLAARADASGHPSLVRWRETMTDVFGDGAVATTRGYKLQRLAIDR